MALQGYADDRNITRSTGSVRGNTLTFGHAAVNAGGTTTTIERPTGGSVTQGGSGINTDTATGSLYTNAENPAFGGAAQTGRPQTTPNPVSGGRGTTVSAGFSGGGGGSVSGNADSQVAVNPQTRQTGLSINPLILVLIPLFLLAFKKK